MTDRTTPTFTTVSTPGTPQPATMSMVTHPMVRRRVRHPHGLNVLGHVYARGAIVTLRSDRAFVLEQSGHLEHGEPT